MVTKTGLRRCWFSRWVLAACGNEEAELAEKANQKQALEQASLDQALAAYNAGDFRRLAVLRPLADAGNIAAQNNVGRMYYDGKGVPENDAEAVKWFQLAAEKGHPMAQFNLGAAYEYGSGVPQDIEQALRWYRQAAQQGQPEAQVNLGRMYDEGLGVAQNPLAASAGSAWRRRGVCPRRSSIWACSTAPGVLRRRTMRRR